MTSVGYSSVTEAIIKASWSLFQHDGVAAIKLPERSPLALPPLSAKDHAGGCTRILNVRPIRRINRHPVESEKDSKTECISVTADWLNRNGDLHNRTDSEEDCAAHAQFDIE